MFHPITSRHSPEEAARERSQHKRSKSKLSVCFFSVLTLNIEKLISDKRQKQKTGTVEYWDQTSYPRGSVTRQYSGQAPGITEREVDRTYLLRHDA